MSKEIGLSLSGSGFRFPTFIGSIQAMLDHGYTITEIAGTSGGSIIAACFACGFTPKQMLDMAHNTPFQTFIKCSLKNILINHYMNDGSDLYAWLSNTFGAKTFADVSIPLNIISTDLNKQKPFAFNKTNTPDQLIALACRASASIPFVFAPIELGDQFLVDGGVSDDLPVNYLTPEKDKFAVELFERSTPLKGIVPIQTLIDKVIDTFINSANDLYLTDIMKCTPIKISTPTGLSLDSNITSEQIDQLYSIGYDATNIILSKL